MHVRHERGFALIEVLVTVIIMLLGLLGLAGLQGAAINAESDAHQRAQALMLLNDMNNRINANRKNAVLYVTGTSPRGTGYNGSDEMDCSGLSVDQRDLCEWHNALLGVSEKRGTQAVGAMVGARGCIYELSSAEPKRYMVAVAWRGLRKSAVPGVECGQDQYDDEAFRRVVSTTITIADLD